MSSSPIPIRRRVVEIASRRRTSARFVHTIYQSDLEKLIGKRNIVRAENKELESMEKDIAAAIKSGARIEEGIHTAEIARFPRKAYRVAAGYINRLEVK